jgi:uncharacterized membrane protein YoaK (UPF0700 family)
MKTNTLMAISAYVTSGVDVRGARAPNTVVTGRTVRAAAPTQSAH